MRLPLITDTAERGEYIFLVFKGMGRGEPGDGRTAMGSCGKKWEKGADNKIFKRFAGREG